MKDIIVTILGILLFAGATIILYIWGIKKSINQQQKLINMLYSKGISKVTKFLKANGSATRKDIENIVDSLKAAEFYSKNRAVVKDKKQFTDSLLTIMLEKDIIIKDKKTYKLK